MSQPKRRRAMIIALDLDNTIINYDDLFHRLARERGLIPPALSPDKVLIRDYLRLHHGDETWQELQALAYGPRLSQAAVFPGVVEALSNWQKEGHRVYIVSHKTTHSSRGGYELHPPAEKFLEESGLRPLVADVFFTDNVPEKILTVCRHNCRVMVDDLPEILAHLDPSDQVTGILFDPSGRNGDYEGPVCASWPEVEALVRNVRA